MKVDDYVEYILGADNAPDMQVRILDFYNNVVTDADIAYSVGEILRGALVYRDSLATKLRVARAQLVDSNAKVLFPTMETKRFWGSTARVIGIYNDNSCVHATPIGGHRFAYRHQLNYKVHADPMHEIFDAPVSFAT